MPNAPAHILVIESAASLAQAYVTALRKDGYEVTVVDTPDAARRGLAGRPADIVLLNLQQPRGDGMDALRALAADPGAGRTLALTAQGSVQVAVEAMRAGAADVLLLPIGSDKLRAAVAAVLATPAAPRVAAPQAAAAPSPDAGTTYFGFIGASPQMRNVYRMIESAAPSKATVFITGESGTGKEVCAEAIHKRSPRAGGPFVPINCAAIPKDLMESEIFGHVKGAFTGATTDHAGAALQANGGTLFLDEICEMDLALQAKLLRFLQTGLVKKVGSERTEAVDVRILCATNRDPYAEVQAGRFREDLFYRLQVISIELPPLRERGDDILLIANAFLDQFSREERKRFKGFSADCQRIMRDYGWPGNVRQLVNVVRNVVVLNEGEEILPFMLPPPLNKPTLIVPPMLQDPRWAAMAGPLPFGFPAMPGAAPAAPPPTMAPQVPQPAAAAPVAAFQAPPAAAEDDGVIKPLWMLEEEAIDRAIRLCGGNITRAAALLEINPCTIYRRRQRKRAVG